MVKFAKSFIRDESGASAAEYALILAIIGSVIAVASIALATSIGGAMDKTTACLDSPTSASCN